MEKFDLRPSQPGWDIIDERVLQTEYEKSQGSLWVGVLILGMMLGAATVLIWGAVALCSGASSGTPASPPTTYGAPSAGMVG